MADLHKVGGRTPQAVIYKSESHKLHQAFPVKGGGTLVQGQPVRLNNDGTISPYTGAKEEVYLGIAVNYSKYPAYPATAVGVEVTVMMEGFAVIHGIAESKIPAPGYVQTSGTLDASGTYPNFSPSTDGAETKFIAINKADVDELVQILVK